MSTTNQTEKKYNDIRTDFEKLSNKKFNNTTIYTEEYIFKKLAEKYYLSSRTIENIVYYRVGGE